MRLTIIRSGTTLGAWLENVLAALPPSLARTATLVVPSHRLTHRVRRDACLAGRPRLLAGVRMRRPQELAHEVLVRAGVETDGGLDELRVVALRALLAAGLPLAYLRPERLADGRSYADAIARTITDLEGAGLTPVDLRSGAPGPALSDRLQDVATLWEAADAQLLSANARLHSPAGLLREAAAALERRPDLLPAFGDVSVVVGPQPTSVLLRLVAALRPRAVAVVTGRPERASAMRIVERVETALGARRETAPEPAVAPRTELDLVRGFLFAPPEELARESRPRSGGADGTVTLGQQPGVHQEIEAAVAWAIEEVTERRTPLEEIAIVVTARDPLAGLLTAALERADTSLPAYVAGGLPLSDAPSGALLLQLLRALEESLASERTIALLPHLRLLEGPERRHVSEAAARAIVYRSGIVGGTPGNPARGREWERRLREREGQLRALIARMESDPDPEREDEPEKARWSLRRRDAVALCEDITAVLPAIAALTTLAGDVLDGAPLAVLWTRILAFHREWCLVPPGPPDAAALLDAALRNVSAHRAAESLVGRDAVEYVLSVLATLRHPHGRHGEPRIFVGTPADAALLRFRAVRVVGAVEGAIPGSPREDPILPDAARLWLEERVPSCLLPTSADRVLRQTHEAFLAATAARERLALSAPRQWIDGTERELAGLMLETAVALGRPDPGTGRPETIPSLASLRRLYVGPGNAARAAWDEDRPAIARLALRRVSSAAGRVPPAWLVPSDGMLSLARLRAIAADRDAADLGISDGVLGPAAGGLELPGLGPERGISASGLAVLLGCPYRFLLANVLGLEAPASAPSVREIGQPDYGSLVHRVMESFSRLHGAAFCRKERKLADWQRIASDAVNARFDEFLSEYPLSGDDTIEAQRRRLQRDVEHLLRAEWESGLSLRFDGVEVGFGYPTPVPVMVDGGRTLHVHGFIDRLDQSGGRLVVRDIKTGRPKARDDEPVDPGIDMQIALYALVAPGLKGGARVSRAAYVYPVAAGDSERAFAGPDLDALLARGREWLGLSADLLGARSFPHTPDRNRCRYCSFQAVCGPDATVVSRRKLEHAPAGSPAARFAALQAPEEPDDGD